MNRLFLVPLAGAALAIPLAAADPAATQPASATQPGDADLIDLNDGVRGADHPLARFRHRSEQLLRLDRGLTTPVTIQQNEVRLDNVIEYFRTVTLLNITVNWTTLAEVGVVQDAHINMDYTDVPAGDVLEHVLEQASASSMKAVGGGGVAWAVNDGIIEISTVADLSRRVETRVYDSRDLISVLGGGEEAATQLVQITHATLRTDPLLRTPADTTTVQMLNGNLILKATPEAHVAVLRQLSEMRSDMPEELQAAEPPPFDLNQALSGTSSGGHVED